MISSFIRLQVDSLAQHLPTEAVQNTALTKEISVLEFIFKGGIFLIPIALLLFYTLYLIFERYMYITRASKIDKHLIPDIRNNLNAGNLDMAISVVNGHNARQITDLFQCIDSVEVMTLGRFFAKHPELAV